MSASTTGNPRCAAAINGWMPLPPPISSDMTARNFCPSNSCWISTARAMLRLSASRSCPTSGAPMFDTTATQSSSPRSSGDITRHSMPLGIKPAHVQEPEIRAAAAAGAENPRPDRQRLDVVEGDVLVRNLSLEERASKQSRQAVCRPRELACCARNDNGLCGGSSCMPLSGIRVVDLTRILAGPFCSMILADMGAEVVKIETPGSGDPVRRQGAIRDGLSWYFAAFNRNKRSLTLNLRSDAGPRGARKTDRAQRRSGRELPSRRDAGHGLRRGPARCAEPGSRLLQYDRVWVERALSRPAILRFHCPGDERVHERDRRSPMARRCAPGRRSPI